MYPYQGSNSQSLIKRSIVRNNWRYQPNIKNEICGPNQNGKCSTVYDYKTFYTLFYPDTNITIFGTDFF